MQLMMLLLVPIMERPYILGQFKKIHALTKGKIICLPNRKMVWLSMMVMNSVLTLILLTSR